MARLYQVKVGGIKEIQSVTAESYAIIRSPQGHAVRFLRPDRTEIVFFDVKWVEEIKHETNIAAMRCYVASKLGDEIEVPE